jgi:glycosyltransferase involved in cell wall biosynthesis
MYFPVLEKILTLRIPNGVNMRYIERCREKEGNFNYDVGFMAARLVPEKGIMDLLEVIYYVRQKIKNNVGSEIKVAILGHFLSEHTKRLFLRRAKELGIFKNISILGYLPEDEKFKVLHSIRVFLYPSIKDCFSISLIEAMACGCPSVVYDLPFTKQFRTEAMFRVRYRDLHTMARIVSNLIMLSYTQPNDFLSLRKSAMNFAKQFKWNEVCKNETLILRRIINNYSVNAGGDKVK